MKEKIKSIISPKIFLAFCITEILILVTLKILQAIFPYSVIEVPPMFSAILLNALFMLLLVIRVNGKGKDPETTGIPLAVFTTLLADCFLVLLHGLSKADLIRFITPLTANMIGFFIFGIVQVIYAFYLGLTKRRWIVRIGLYLVFIVSVAAAGLLTFDRFIACLSMSQLILNLVYAWSEHRKKRTVASLIFAVGITLFFGCDFCIMLRMLLPPQGLIYDVIRFMVWVFYIPSQAVLTSSYLADKANQ